ncbi:MAG: molybdopterin-dependent oxidoreductase [Nitriliruptorales bacterium]|nr:molybdopterin-dependent oxidoreductase [Nitriliruptorales bacterium]
MAASFGRGAMTNHWKDFKNSDMFLVVGANPAEAHPCGWRWAYRARDERGAKIIHVDPRYTRTSATADVYAPIRAGTDVAFFNGLINYVLDNELYHEEYVRQHTNASFIVAESFSFDEGVFSGYDEAVRGYDTSTWDYEYEKAAAEAGEDSTGDERPPATGSGESAVDPRGFVRTDDTLQDPRSVFQLLKEHVSRYTPEVVSEITGIPEEKFLEIAELWGSTGAPDRVGAMVYAVGLTHHVTGLQMIRSLGMLQLLLGNVGRTGGGVNAERGHANIQGNTDNAISWEILPGYLGIPRPGMETLDDYIEQVPAKQLAMNSLNFFGSRYRDFLVSLQKAFFGDAATEANDWAYDWIPKPAENSSWLTAHNEALQNRLQGLIAFGFHNPAVGPDTNRVLQSLSNLKWLVAMDPLPTAASEFWRAPGVEPDQVDTEVFFLPCTHWIEKDGAFTNSGRWAQWKWKALEPEGEIKDDHWVLAQLYLGLRDLYEEEDGAFPDPILGLAWPYSDPGHPPLEELAKEMNGRNIETGEQLSTFADLKSDGTTLSGNWIYAGSWTEEGNQMARRNNDDPTGMGFHHEWAWSWPLNRRVLYNRASADENGRPWDPRRPGIQWNGSLWVGDVPDFPPDEAPDVGTGAFIMTGEGVGRLFAPGGLTNDGPFPEHYEPTEAPVENAVPQGRREHPTAFFYDGARESFAPAGGDFPYVATTYRITEHEHYVTQHVPYLVETQPDFFVELDPDLAAEKGIANGSQVRVRSMRGEVEGVAMVTKRMRPLRLGRSKIVHQIGIPVHWSYVGGKARAKSNANLLTPYIGDSNVRTPEFKGFLVDIEAV